MKDILHTVIEIGLEKPVYVLHVTDVHLCTHDAHDEPSQRTLLDERRAVFYGRSASPRDYLEEAIALAEQNGYLLVLTGDAIDLNSHGNRAELAEILAGHDLMFTPGGHEFQRVCVRTLHEDPPYAEHAIPQVQAAFPQFRFACDSRIIGGVNIVTLDNSLDYFPRAALEGLQNELQKGLPTVVFMHEPLYNGYLRHTVELHPNVTARVSEDDYRASDEVIRLIETHPLIITSFAGHDHEHITYEREGKVHYATDALFNGKCRLIEFR